MSCGTKHREYTKTDPKNRSGTVRSTDLESSSTNDTKTRKALYQRVVALREEKKLSERAIAAELNVPKTTVHEYLTEWKQKTPVSELKVRGRPKKLGSGDKRFVRQLFVTNPSSTVKDVCNALQVSRGKEVSKDTVRRMLSKMNLRFGKPQVVPLLTDMHKSNRMKWCKEQMKLKLDGVFFSDETYIEVGNGKRGVWYKKGNRPKVGKAKFPVKLMFWGAISCHSKSPLFTIDGTMNSNRYIALLGDEFLPWIAENHIEMRLFQQDIASCHTPKTSKAFFASQGIQILD